MAKKGNRVQVILECTEHKTSGMPGMSRYITTKNKKNTTERLEEIQPGFKESNCT
jgi:large subunit ribosomal protein L33